MEIHDLASLVVKELGSELYDVEAGLRRIELQRDALVTYAREIEIRYFQQRFEQGLRILRMMYNHRLAYVIMRRFKDWRLEYQMGRMRQRLALQQYREQVLRATGPLTVARNRFVEGAGKAWRPPSPSRGPVALGLQAKAAAARAASPASGSRRYRTLTVAPRSKKRGAPAGQRRASGEAPPPLTGVGSLAGFFGGHPTQKASLGTTGPADAEDEEFRGYVEELKRQDEALHVSPLIMPSQPPEGPETRMAVGTAIAQIQWEGSHPSGSGTILLGSSLECPDPLTPGHQGEKEQLKWWTPTRARQAICLTDAPCHGAKAQ
jgi:hypothetical protein